MTLPATTPVNSYTGNGSANSYPFTYPVFNSTDITVQVQSPAKVAFNLTLGTDFTVSGLNPAGGPAITGSITLVNSSQAWLTAGNLTTGWIIVISRVVALIQNTSIRNQGDFYPETLETALDYLMMAIQQVQALANPTIPLSLTVVTGDITFTTAGSGIILTDIANGHTYRILMSNGIISQQQVS